MSTLLLILLVTGVGLTALLYLGSLFFQGYIYTEPSPVLPWAAPAAGALLTLFLTVWCLANVVTEGANPEDIPYDAFHRFSPYTYLLKKPAVRMWAVRKDGKRVEYVSQRRDQRTWDYVNTANNKPWNTTADVTAVEIEHDGQKMRFDRRSPVEGGNVPFVSPDGWTMTDYGAGPTGEPMTFRFGRLLANLAFNGLHFALWFVALWLLLRYAWAHALGFAFVLWLTFTLALLPMLLGYAAEVAVQRRAPAPSAARLGPPAPAPVPA